MVSKNQQMNRKKNFKLNRGKLQGPKGSEASSTEIMFKKKS